MAGRVKIIRKTISSDASVLHLLYISIWDWYPAGKRDSPGRGGADLVCGWTSLDLACGWITSDFVPRWTASDVLRDRTDSGIVRG